MGDRVKCILNSSGKKLILLQRGDMYCKRRQEVISSVEEVYEQTELLPNVTTTCQESKPQELQKANYTAVTALANNTVATAFPDQDQYSIL
jgi:hypothetical protein